MARPRDLPDEAALDTQLRRRVRVRVVSSALLALAGVAAGLAYALWPEFTGSPSATAGAFGRRLLGALCVTVVACTLAALFAWSALARFVRHQQRTRRSS